MKNLKIVTLVLVLIAATLIASLVSVANAQETIFTATDEYGSIEGRSLPIGTEITVYMEYYDPVVCDEATLVGVNCVITVERSNVSESGPWTTEATLLNQPVSNGQKFTIPYETSVPCFHEIRKKFYVNITAPDTASKDAALDWIGEHPSWHIESIVENPDGSWTIIYSFWGVIGWKVDPAHCVPEPATIAALVVPLATFGGFHLRKRIKKSSSSSKVA